MMVGYPKRYDPAYVRFARLIGQDTRLLRVTTLESPFRPYLRHYRLLPPAKPPDDVLARLRAEATAAAAAAIGPGSDSELRVYQGVLLNTLVHELNAVRGLLGEPDLLEYAEMSEQAVTVLLRFGAVRVAIHWIDLPGIARYQMEFAAYAPDSRATLTFGSPYLRDEPAVLVAEGGEPGTAQSWRHEETAGYERLPARTRSVQLVRHRRHPAGHIRQGRAGRHRALRGDHRLPQDRPAGPEPDGGRVAVSSWRAQLPVRTAARTRRARRRCR
jgi:predicted dehydrogenase